MFGIHRFSANQSARRARRGPATRPTSHRHRWRRSWTFEALEDRTLLSTFTVTSLADSSATGTLRWAITQADQTKGNNTINFTVTGTITLNSALPDLSNTTGLTDVEGPGAASLTVARSSAAGTPEFRIFTVDTNANVKLVGLTVTGGLVSDHGGGIDNSGTLSLTNSILSGNSSSAPSSLNPTGGGGIFNNGTLTITNSTIAHNSASDIFNLVSHGSGIDNSGALAVTNSTIADNIAGSFGGGIYNESGGTVTVTNSTIAQNNGVAFDGGGIFNGGTLTVTNSTIAGNSVSGDGTGAGIANFSTVTVMITNSTIADNSSHGSGGGIGNGGTMTVNNSTIDRNNSGIFGGGGIDNHGTMTVNNSTIAHNSAGDEGGGLAVDAGTMTVINSTIADNSAGNVGGGISIGFVGGTNFGTLTVTNSTIARNSAPNGGGGLDAGGTAKLFNTVVSLNTAGTGGGAPASDIALNGGTVSGAYNLIGTGGSGGLVNGVNHNQVGVAKPGLGPLAFYGGPTQTIALLPGSPAIDKGSNALAVDSQGNPLTTDQRGTGFERIVNGTVDIGAYEFLPAANDAVAVGWGTQTASLQTAADGLRLLPAGRNTDLPWLGINQFQLTLSQAQTLTPADITVNSAIGVDYGPVSVSGSGKNYTITLAQPVSVANRLTITIVNPGISMFNRRLDVLPGDFNDDGVVNSQDLVGVRNELLGIIPPTIFGDINGDGKVDIKDYNAVRRLIGTTLPPLT